MNQRPLDKKGIIRVGGRLNKSTLPSGMKNPIIIPKRCRLTELVIDEAHSVTLHGGARLTLSYIRQRYWIVGGNRVVKAQLRHCVKCCRYKTTQHHQIMADLPPQRITPSRPFTHAGVDFTGHVEVKLNKGRGVKSSKGYIAIFVCMATKAVHIELVSDLSTETFLAAFHRMCARRGTPKHMYSDCGTNFIGTSKRLRREFEDFKVALSPAFFNEIGKMEVEWHFNAPAWPNAGGLWEAAVKSMKHHLHRVLGDQRLTYEEFSTLLAKIEGCMNSRPLCPLTEDPEEFYNYLTPGHFMTGGPILTVPCADYCDVNKIDLRRRYHLTEHMLQQFWKRWANDYLTTLQVRSKWNTPTANIKEGDIVLVKENNLPPGKWALGRVTQLHPGSDGYVRVTTLKTQNGTIKRPVVKLSPLPIQNHSELNKETLQTDEQTKPAKRLTKNCFNTLFSTLLTMFIVVTGARAQASGHSDMTPGARITNIDADRPLYYDAMGKIQLLHDEWILLMYYNLTNYWDGIQHMQGYLNGINDLCERTDPRYCKTTLEQLYHEMDLINYYNSILLTPHKHLTERRKRGLINGVGSIANSLFGLLDQNFADKYSNDIDSIQRNEKHLMELIKNQTSVVELQTNILKMTEENIKKQFNSLDYFINQTEANIAKLESQLAVVMASSYFSSASLASFLLINNLKKMQELFFNTLTDVYRGHIDVHLITPANLIEQINDISGKLPKSLAWPIENIREDLKNLYKLMYVKARVTRNFFLFEIHIPLVSDDEFKLHRVFALPISTNTGRVVMQLSSEYIAVNFERSTYTTLREGDINSCIQIKVDNFICNKNLPIFDLHNNKAPCEAKLLGHRTLPSCELKTTLCKDEWIQLHAPNSWLTICCGVCTLRMICENDMTSHTMNQSGIITLSQGCVLQSDHAMIHSHNQYRSDIKLNSSFMTPSLMSPINNLVHIKHYNLSHIKLTDDSMLMELNTSLRSLRAQEDHFPETITTHDIHQYVICYGLLGIAIIVIIVWAVKKCKTATCLNLRWKRTPKNKSVYEDIELQTISKRLESHQEKLKNNPSSSLEQRIERPGRRNASGADNIAFDFD